MHPTLSLALGLSLLAACATPQQSCLTSVTRDLRVVDGLIAETGQNLARGYALETRPGVRSQLELCVSPDDPFLFCTSQQVIPTERPVAIDVAAERAKLAALQTKRAELAAKATSAAATCRSQFPDS